MTDQVRSNRRVIHVTCTQHGGARGFTNLVVRKVDGGIELDPHVLRADSVWFTPMGGQCSPDRINVRLRYIGTEHLVNLVVAASGGWSWTLPAATASL